MSVTAVWVTVFLCLLILGVAGFIVKRSAELEQEEQRKNAEDMKARYKQETEEPMLRLLGKFKFEYEALSKEFPTRNNAFKDFRFLEGVKENNFWDMMYVVYMVSQYPFTYYPQGFTIPEYTVSMKGSEYEDGFHNLAEYMQEFIYNAEQRKADKDILKLCERYEVSTDFGEVKSKVSETPSDFNHRLAKAKQQFDEWEFDDERDSIRTRTRTERDRHRRRESAKVWAGVRERETMRERTQRTFRG